MMVLLFEFGPIKCFVVGGSISYTVTGYIIGSLPRIWLRFRKSLISHMQYGPLTKKINHDKDETS